MRYEVNTENALWRILDGEAVIISVETSHYYSLNKTGTFIWGLLSEEALTREDLVARVAESYSRAPADVATDVAHILDELTAEKLITTR